VKLESDPMLLVTCQADANRYAIDSRHVSEVLPRLGLERLSGSPPWLAGLLVYRGAATPVVDLTQLTEGRPCPNRLSSRIIVLRTELEGLPRRIGVLAERVGLRELSGDLAEVGDETAGETHLGKVFLDEQGVFQLIDIERLVSQDRQAFLGSNAQRPG
jgi:chemotaxis-related protein WspB